MDFTRMWYTLRHKIEEKEGLPIEKGSVYELLKQVESGPMDHRVMWITLTKIAEEDYDTYPRLRSTMREIEKDEIGDIVSGLQKIMDICGKISGLFGTEVGTE